MSPMKHGHALIIEDELMMGLAMQSILSPLGYGSFAFASTAAQALEQARLRRPDLVTVDVNLMHGTGLEAANSILAEYGRTPVIYVTGDPEALGAIDPAVVVRKPYGPADIARACAASQAGAA